MRTSGSVSSRPFATSSPRAAPRHRTWAETPGRASSRTRSSSGWGRPHRRAPSRDRPVGGPAGAAQAARHGTPGVREDEPPGCLGGLSDRPGRRLHDLRGLPDLQRRRLERDLAHALRGRRVPLAAVLARPLAPVRPAAVAQPRPPDPVDPDRLPGHLLLLPKGVLPLLLRGSARLRGRRADGPPPVRAGERPAVRPAEPASVPAVPRLHPADVP